MDIPFITLKKYDALQLNVAPSYSQVGLHHALMGEPLTDLGSNRIVFDRVREILAAKNQTMAQVYRLSYQNVNNFDNALFRIATEDGGPSYFLKMLDSKPGNHREVFVWKHLGYDSETGLRKNRTWIRGLPPEVYPLGKLACVLMPFYPGQLKGAFGNHYPFSLVTALLACLAETLQGLHDHGLVFMDLCPDNIMVLPGQDGLSQLFFLTDMGSVKLLKGCGEGAAAEALSHHLIPDRMTRAETRPDKRDFPPLSDDSLEEPAGYDWHTLARTALVLLGLGRQAEPRAAQPFFTDFDLDQLTAPRRAEMTKLLSLLAGPLSGKPLDRPALLQLHCDYFLDRAAFLRDQVGAGDLHQTWALPLQRQAQAHRSILEPDARKNFLETLAQRLLPNQNSAVDTLEPLQQLPQLIRSGALPSALACLEQLEASTLCRHSATVRYSLHYHRKILRHLVRGDIAVGRSSFQAASLAAVSDVETLEALRRRQNPELGILTRRLNATLVDENAAPAHPTSASKGAL